MAYKDSIKKSFYEDLSHLSDLRGSQGKRYYLPYVLATFILGILVGRKEVSSIHRYMENRHKFLSRLFNYLVMSQNSFLLNFVVKTIIYQKVLCRYCSSNKLIKAGKQSGQQRVKCKTCNRTFQLDYTYEANKPGVTEKIEKMAHNGNGTRETARLLNINKNTVTAHLKKKQKQLNM